MVRCRGAERGRGKTGFELFENEARVEVNVATDGEDGDAAVVDVEGGKVGAGKGGGLELGKLWTRKSVSGGQLLTHWA